MGQFAWFLFVAAVFYGFVFNYTGTTFLVF